MYDVRVNGDLVYPTQHTFIETNKEKVCFEVAKDRIKKIEIEFKNKLPNDTVVCDEKIVEDVLIIVDNLAVDCVNLSDKIAKISVYKDSQGVVHRTNNYITFNGTMTIKIHKNPVYTNWLSNFI